MPQPMAEQPVIYDERDGIAFITINRPDKKNTLTESVVQGIADGIDQATRSPQVAAIVLRGAGDTFTAGYDLTSKERWDTPYGAPTVEARKGAWDPVRDMQFMGNNVRRFMKIWECPKPVLGEIRGWAVGGATDLVLCCDLLFMASDAHIGYAPSRIYGTPTTMMWVYRLGLEHAKQFLLTGRAIDAETALRIGLVSYVEEPEKLSAMVEAEARRFRHIPANQLALNKLLVNQAFENMGLRTTQMLGTFFDGVTRHTEEAYRWVEGFEEKGFREVIRERDRPWQDYGERPRPSAPNNDIAGKED
jgi:enoyl-CoA hydratase